ncbi:ABC transporter substrate-binding protein [Vibrio navarrensis]|uniref:ABC transporter substrate-binding protein SapA n=2 Tax=Vibrio navarrensis TaxID=29495 RepID=UPI001869DE48|nr:ABC transporter substrate-binding protein SapA [Vibrio navarrensis]MBE4583385.1 ABC transporter substrate-binding protein [Vibrio navarrensis]MBE4608945.1 ABC transporter substrate-binding protein [Vibrio navarrensis]MBE4612496.1 ABC transporter substrate-binding protein [Vibrio navarrensis]
MKTLIQLAFGLIGIGLLTGCGNEVDHTEIRKSGFVFCGQSNLKTFNPQLIDSGITADALSPQIYDTLLTLDPTTHQPIASIAQDWQVNKSGTEYIFNLRTDVAFQNTAWFTPTRNLNAQDVVFSFRRIIDPTHPYHLVGGGSYPWFTGIDLANLLTDVVALSDHQVKFILSRPNFAFLSNLATSHAVILSAEYGHQLAQQDSKEKLDLYPVGSGPFALEEYQINDLVRLRRHEHYWRGPVKMEQVVFDISQRGTGTLAKLLRNECDVLSSPISSQIPVIEKHPNMVLTATPAMNVAFIAINTSHLALQDVRVRQALNLAINRQNILDSVYYGTGTLAYTLLPPSSWAYQKDSVKIRFDRNYALALLREAGYESGLTLSMWVPSEPSAYNPSPRKTAELIQANLTDIGIQLNLLYEERFERVLPDETAADLILTGWVADTGDPDNFLRPLLSCNSELAGINVAMWCNSDFDFLLDLALETEKNRYRLNLYRQAQNILNEEFPVIPLAHGVQFRAHDKSLVGFKSSPFNSQPFDSVERTY